MLSTREYVHDLIGRRSQERINKEVAFLEKAIAGAPMGDPSDKAMAEIVKTQRHIRNELERARGKKRLKPRK